MKFPEQATATSTLGARSACELDADGTAQIMSILSNMYTNARAAVLREYAANALDANRAAGNPSPVNVVLPTDLTPMLTISDAGVGLSLDEIVTVYSRYGASTKRNDSSAIGGFGIGAKAAFTLTSQFIVDAVKDGFRSVVVFSLDNGMPGYTTISHEPTIERNRVTVRIATRVGEAETWKAEADRVFQTWEKGTVLIDGLPPESLFDRLTQISEHVWVSPTRFANYDLLIVSGGIGYRCDETFAERVASIDEQHLSSAKSKRLVVTLPVGAVDLNPSRESVRDSRRSLDAIAAAILTASRAAQDQYDAEMSAADTIPDQIAVAKTFRMARSAAMGAFPFPQLMPINVRAFKYRAWAGRSESSTLTTRLTPENLDHHTIVLIAETTTETGIRRVLSRFTAMTGKDRHIIVLRDDTEALHWLPLDRGLIEVLHESTIRDAVRSNPAASPKARTSRTASQVKYNVIDGTGPQHPVDLYEIAQSDLPVAYVRFGRNASLHDARLVIPDLHSKYLIVVLTGNQSVHKLESRIPGALPLSRVLATALDDTPIDPITAAAAAMNQYDAQKASRIIGDFPQGAFRTLVEQALAVRELMNKDDVARALLLARHHSVPNPLPRRHPAAWWLLMSTANAATIRGLRDEFAGGTDINPDE